MFQDTTNYDDLFGKASKLQSVSEAFPIFFVNSLSSVAGYIVQTKKQESRQLLEIYRRHADTIALYVPKFFGFPLCEISHEDSQNTFQAIKVGLVLYVYWRNVPSATPNLQQPGESFLCEVEAILHQFLKAGQPWLEEKDLSDDPAYIVDYESAYADRLSEGRKDLKIQTIHMVLVMVSSVLFGLGSVRAYPADVQKRAEENAVEVFSYFVINGKLSGNLGTRGQKNKEWIDVGYKLVPEVMKARDLQEMFGFLGDADEYGKAQGDRQGGFNFYTCVVSLFNAFGIKFQDCTFAKKDREQILQTIAQNTWYVGDSTEGLFTDSERQECIAFVSTIYVLGKKLEQARKKLYLQMLEEERKPQEPKREESGASVLQEAERERKKNRAIQKEVEKLRQQLSQEHEENMRLRNKNVALSERLQSLQESLTELQADNAAVTEEEQGDIPPEPHNGTRAIIGEQPEVQCQEMTLEARAGYIDQILKEKRVIVVGGDHNLMKKWVQQHPDLRWIPKDRTVTFDAAIKDADLILFKADALNHASYIRAKKIAAKAEKTIDYMKRVTSMELLDADLFQLMKKHFSGGERS